MHVLVAKNRLPINEDTEKYDLDSQVDPTYINNEKRSWKVKAVEVIFPHK